MFRTLSAAPTSQPAGAGFAATLCPPAFPAKRTLLDTAMARLLAAVRPLKEWNDRRVAIAEFRRLDPRMLGDIGLDLAQARAVVDAMMARRDRC